MKDYVVVDIETTGFNCHKDKIIEVGMLFIKDNAIVNRYDSLINPDCKIPKGITELTGITNEMVENAPKLDDILPDLISKIYGSDLLGHNISFDMDFLRESCFKLGLNLDNPCTDTKTLAHKLLPDLPYFSLENVCLALNVTNNHAHRALSDCEATLECYKKLLDISESGEKYIIPDVEYVKEKRVMVGTPKYTNETKALKALEELVNNITSDNVVSDDEVYLLKKWLDDNQQLCGNYPFDRIKKAIEKVLEDNIIEQNELDELLDIFKKAFNPDYTEKVDNEHINFSGKTVCVTGDFKLGSRSEVTKILEGLGAVVKSGVSGKTDYLIVGSLGSDAWKHGNYGGKIKTAMELNEKGKNIVIIAEEDFVKSIPSGATV